MNSSLKFWLILSFSIVIIICLTVLFVFKETQVKTDKIESYIKLLQNTRISLLETDKLKEEIFVTELINSDFYEQENSLQERKLSVSFDKTTNHLEQLKASNLIHDHDFISSLNLIESNLNEYRSNYKELIRLFKWKGYKNYGLEGRMRNYAHKITDNLDPKIKYYSLLLRKHEKDFLIRKEIAYISSFNDVQRELINYISNSVKYNYRQKNELFNLVYFYNKYFKLISRIENKIGVKGAKGLISYSKIVFERTNNKIKRIENFIGKIELKRKAKIQQMSIVIFASMILFLFIIIAFLINAITRSVADITYKFERYTNSGFTDIGLDYKRSHIKEFNLIYLDFLKMAKEINIYTNFFKEKVHERTLEISKQKEEIKEQQKRIEIQYEDLKKTNLDLVNKKRLLNERNKDMIDSLQYSKRIQKALLPKSNEYSKYFEDKFVFTKAKDIVSGDFNLIYPFKTYELNDDVYSSNNNVLLIAADCTGHGVPGAFISVLGINSINKLVELLNITDPGNLLDCLNSDINDFLSIDKNEKDLILDGMDISVFSFNRNTFVLKYCIAKFTCILIRNSEFIELVSHNYSIGYNIGSVYHKNFETQSIQLMKDDCLYLLSDGYYDQFGGPMNKKYKRKSLYELILNIHKKPMKEQKSILKNELKDWQRHYTQTDDISFIGLRF